MPTFHSIAALVASLCRIWWYPGAAFAHFVAAKFRFYAYAKAELNAPFVVCIRPLLCGLSQLT